MFQSEGVRWVDLRGHRRWGVTLSLSPVPVRRMVEVI